jgi:outer membrane lipoprotein SlyB
MIMKTLCALLFALAVAGCSTTSPDVVQRGDAQRLSSVQDAVVISVRPVVVDGSQSGVGAVTGAVVGGVAGSTVGSGATSTIVGVLAGVAGGVIGNTVERRATTEQAIEIILQLSNGERRAIVQAQGTEVISAGDRVVLVSTGGTTRVTRAQ